MVARGDQSDAYQIKCTRAIIDTQYSPNHEALKFLVRRKYQISTVSLSTHPHCKQTVTSLCYSAIWATCFTYLIIGKSFRDQWSEFLYKNYLPHFVNTGRPWEAVIVWNLVRLNNSITCLTTTHNFPDNKTKGINIRRLVNLKGQHFVITDQILGGEVTRCTKTEEVRGFGAIATDYISKITNAATS